MVANFDIQDIPESSASFRLAFENVIGGEFEGESIQVLSIRGLYTYFS
jgi:hypothetical protein